MPHALLNLELGCGDQDFVQSTVDGNLPKDLKTGAARCFAL